MRKYKKQTLILLIIIMLILPHFLDIYWLDVLTLVLFYVVLAQGLNVVVGYTGLLDLGYAAFFAVGAYTTAILMTTFHWSFWLTLPVAFVFAVLAGVIVGTPTLRLRSDYLAIVTLGFGEIVRILATNLEITGSASGIYGIPRPTIGSYVISTQKDFYYLILIVAIITIIIVYRLGHSRIGRAWIYIREDEDAAEAMGINRVRLKLLSYASGAVIGSFAGSIFAVKMTAIAPLSFSFLQSVMILLAVVLGGLGSIPGVVVGAVIVIVLPEMLRGVEEWRHLIFGVALVIMMIFRPQGIWPPKYDGDDDFDDPENPDSKKPNDEKKTLSV